MLLSYIFMVFVSEYVEAQQKLGMQKRSFHRKCNTVFVHVVFNYYPETLMLVSTYKLLASIRWIMEFSKVCTTVSRVF